MKAYDVIWIGTGQATGTVIPRLAKAGKKIAIAEGGCFGGSCVNYGCTPTKTLVASARNAHMVRRSSDFGVGVKGVTIDFDQVMQRQIDIRKSGSEGMQSWLEGMDNVDIYRQYARFKDEQSVQIGDRVISGDTIVIHTGARARKPQINGLDQVDWLDNVRLLDLEKKPDHLIVVGGSYIGLEFGQAFRRFGCEVTILERGPQLIFREDEDVAETALEIMQNEGIAIELDTDIIKIEQTGDDIQVQFNRNGSSHAVQGSHLLIGAGRRPNSDNLNLEATAIETDQRGYIEVNEYGQTAVDHIYALGDVNGKGAFTHTSVDDGQVFWQHYSGKGDRRIDDRIPIYAMYIDPPLGRVGMSQKQAQAGDKNVLIATLPTSQISRAREKDETAGRVKLLVDAENEQFLGATVFGVGGDEIISTIATFMYSRQSYKTFQRAVLPHPTVAEMLPFILDGLKPLR